MPNILLTGKSLYRYAKTLKRRRDWLLQRIQESRSDLSYDKSEAAALSSAVALMEYFANNPQEIPDIHAEEK